MREHLGFLKVSSAIVRVAAWIFLLLGAVGGISVFLGTAPQYPRWVGAVVLAAYAFLFLLLHLIARTADLLVKLIDERNK